MAFEFPLNNDWADLALGRKAIRLGLVVLELDGLIQVELRAGRPSIVTLMPITPETKPES